MFVLCEFILNKGKGLCHCPEKYSDIVQCSQLEMQSTLPCPKSENEHHFVVDGNLLMERKVTYLPFTSDADKLSIKSVWNHIEYFYFI